MIKPPYKVPSMAEIEQVEPNGLHVVSTFSGAGGSCLGYRMAGFKVVWANEFIKEAQQVYRLNHPSTFLNTSDIRKIEAEQVLAESGMKIGEIDIFDGSPPCSAFSMAGKRDEGWGKKKAYSSGGQEQVVDDLFFEYARLLKGLQPRYFIAENVPGLLIGKARGYFNLILRALRDCGYGVRASVFDASRLGVPQARKRLIFIGARNDIKQAIRFPSATRYVYTVRDAIGDLPPALAGSFWPLPKGSMTNLYDRAGHPRFRGMFNLANREMIGKDGYFVHRRLLWDSPSPTVVAQSMNTYHPEEPRSLSIQELKRVCSFPDDFKLTGSIARQWERLGRAVPPVMMKAIATAVRESMCDGEKGGVPL